MQTGPKCARTARTTSATLCGVTVSSTVIGFKPVTSLTTGPTATAAPGAAAIALAQAMTSAANRENKVSCALLPRCPTSAVIGRFYPRRLGYMRDIRQFTDKRAALPHCAGGLVRLRTNRAAGLRARLLCARARRGRRHGSSLHECRSAGARCARHRDLALPVD